MDTLKRFGLVIAAVLVCSRALAQTPQDRFVDVNGLRLHFLDWGNEGKQPLILPYPEQNKFWDVSHAADVKSWVGLPLMYRGQPVGF